MEGQKEVQSEFRRQQEKYTYYVIALCVASIGYSVNMTLGQPLRKSEVPLAMAIISWGLSVYCGLRLARHVLDTLYVNSIYFDVENDRHMNVITSSKADLIVTEIKRKLDILIDKGIRMSVWQNRFFFIGMISFIAWRLWEMYLIT